MSDKLSVCIVAYNNYAEIMEAVNSIEQYTSSKITKKIYIVDNGVKISRSSEVEAFKKALYAVEDTVYIDACENVGFGKGHNRIIPIINSQYHAILNPDILLYEDSFSKIIDWMDRHRDVGMTIPLIVDELGNRQEVYRKELTVFDLLSRVLLRILLQKREKRYTFKGEDFTKPFQVPFGQGSFLVIRSKLFKELKGFDENFFMYVEDADLCKRVNEVSKLMYYPGTRVLHKWKRSSRSNKTLFRHHLESVCYYFSKWGIKWF